ncbi:MAG: uracil-DNA glycosylase [Chitinophagales bacterium]|nr:uracil-DNA glycosylase [Chitinophagales bacterium]MDW8427627.1 uracil-DNA glycosylase [Chitinophagales bacterium]
MQRVEVKIEESWKRLLDDQFQQTYFRAIIEALRKEKAQGITIYPPGPLIFNAFNLTPFHQVRVVILGQDPYHGPGQAHGLCFSVPDGIEFPPSLQNIFKELQDDLGYPPPRSGNLEKWARQGVLLLNAILTVRANQAASHQHLGWQRFTDYVIRLINELRQGVVFLLWGKFAQEKVSLIDSSNHYVLKAAHPSPLSAPYGFFGCRHFSRTNELLRLQGLPEIDWRLE